jgi:hypothetical protein
MQLNRLKTHPMRNVINLVGRRIYKDANCSRDFRSNAAG